MNMTIKDVKWFSVWNKPEWMSLGDLEISEDVIKSILDKWYTVREVPAPPPVKDDHGQEDTADKPLTQTLNGILSHLYIDMTLKTV